MGKILITGATGHLGRVVIEHLLTRTKAENIVALVRDESKAKDLQEKNIGLRTGSYDDLISLERAVEGVDKVLLISGLDANRLQQHKNIVDAAKKASVQHILYTGVALRDVTTSAIKAFMDDHFLTEDYIKESGLAYTFLRNTLYAEAVPMFAGEKAIETGIYLPAGDGKVPFVHRKDLGEATAKVLVEGGHENKIYQLTGGTLYSYSDVVRLLSEISGSEVSFTDADANTFPNTLRQSGVPEAAIFVVSGFTADVKNKQFEIESDDLERLLGRKPTALKEVLKEVYNV